MFNLVLVIKDQGYALTIDYIKYVCMYVPMKYKIQRQSKATKVNECQSKKKRRSNTEKFKITKANEYESEKHPIQRFEIVYDIHKLP